MCLLFTTQRLVYNFVDPHADALTPTPSLRPREPEPKEPQPMLLQLIWSNLREP